MTPKSIFEREWEVRQNKDLMYCVGAKGFKHTLFNLEDCRTLARYICKLHNDHLKEEANRKELAELARLERETDAL